VLKLMLHRQNLFIGVLAAGGCMNGSFANIQLCTDPDEVDVYLSADEPSSSGVTPAQVLEAMSEPFVGQFVVTESVALTNLPSTFSAAMRFSNVDGREVTGVDVVEGDCSRFLQVYVGLIIESEDAGFDTVIEGYVAPSETSSRPVTFFGDSRQSPVIFEDDGGSEPVFLLLEEYWEGAETLRWVMSEGVEDLNGDSRPFASGTWTITDR
jgi:hypothetical protein